MIKFLFIFQIKGLDKVKKSYRSTKQNNVGLKLYVNEIISNIVIL